MTRMTGPDCAVGYVQFNKYTYIHTYIHSYIHAYMDQCEWHRMTRMTGPDCAVMCNLINIHTYIHTYIHILSTNHVNSRIFSSRCWAFWRTHPSADPIRLLGIRLALPSTLSLPSAFVPSIKLMVGASPRALGLVKSFSCDYMFWDERGGGLAPVGPRVDTATIRTVVSTDRVDSGSFSSGCCAFRRTHTSADPIRLVCIRL